MSDYLRIFQATLDRLRLRSATKNEDAETSADVFLARAAEILRERGKQYDQPSGERSMEKCVTAFNTITGNQLSESDGWLFMQILKDVRQWQKDDYHQDSAEDCICYAALKAEALAKGL